MITVRAATLTIPIVGHGSSILAPTPATTTAIAGEQPVARQLAIQVLEYRLLTAVLVVEVVRSGSSVHDLNHPGPSAPAAAVTARFPAVRSDPALLRGHVVLVAVLVLAHQLEVPRRV